MVSDSAVLTEADDLVATAEVILVVGPGGVGKTTLSAALAARAAAVHGRRALVVTVDPARRLADALGLVAVREAAVPVDVATAAHRHRPTDGAMFAMMVDMAASWDALIARHAPDAETRDKLLANRLYRTLTKRFVQSHDYIALDHLVDLADEGDYDLVVVDTPPSSHVLDVLDAPGRMIDFFGSQLLTWLTAPYRNRLVMTTAKPFLMVAERLLGGPFLAEITEFFWLFSSLQKDFVRRAEQVRGRLEEDSTKFVVVQTAEAAPAAQAKTLIAGLAERRYGVALRLVNRVFPEAVSQLGADEVDTLADDDLQSGVVHVIEVAERQRVLGAVLDTEHPVQTVPWNAVPVGDIEGLIGLLDGEELQQ